MNVSTGRARGVLAIFLAVPAALVASAIWPATAAEGDAVGEYCYVVADKTKTLADDDTLSRVDTGVFSPSTNETVIGKVGTGSIEALALKPKSDPPLLYASDSGRLGTIDTSTAAFIAIGPFGSGTGPLGTQSFRDADGLTFDPQTGWLYASIRRSGPDLLIRVDPASGAAVPKAFGGADYAVIAPVNGLADIDDITIGGRLSDVVNGRYPMWAIANDGGSNPRLIKINRSGDTFTGATTDVGATLVKDLEGLSWGNVGLWASSGKLNSIEGIWEVNPDTGLASNPRVLDDARDYESIACPPPAILEVVVGPKTGLNQVAGQHAFTVTVTRASKPVAGAVPSFQVNGVGSIASNGCAGGTSNAGTCTVTVTSNDPGTTNLVATVTTSVGQSTLGTDSDTGTTRWVGMGHTSGCATAPVGALVPYTVSFTVAEDLTDVTLTERLPNELVFQSATPIHGVTPVAPAVNQRGGGNVTWTIPQLPAGTYMSIVRTRIAVNVPSNSDVTSTFTLSHGGHTVQKTQKIRVNNTATGIGVCPAPLRLIVEPKLGLNLLKTEHAFTVTVIRDGAPGVGLFPRTELISTGTVASNTCASEGTDANGRCMVILTSPLPGTGILTATYDLQVGDAKITATDVGTIIWVGLIKDVSCLTAPLGALLPYTVRFEIGDDLNDVTVSDRLPAELVFQSASPINGVAPVTPDANEGRGGVIRWTFDHLPAGTYSGTVWARPALDVPTGTKLTNILTLTHAGKSVEQRRTIDLLDTSVIDELLRSGKLIPSAVCPLPIDLTVLPKLGLNLLKDTHTFTVDLLVDGKGVEGLKPETTLVGTHTLLGDAVVENTCATVGTDANGRCTVTLRSALPGTAVLTAAYDLYIGDQVLRRTDVGTIVWVGLSKDTVCPLGFAPPTTPVPYQVDFEIGEDAEGLRVTDHLPDGAVFVSAAPINGVLPSVPAVGTRGGEVTWRFPSLPAGSYSGIVNIVVAPDLPAGVVLGNLVELELDGLSVWEEHELTVIDPISVTDALAFGVEAHLPGITDINPTPATEEGGSALASVPGPAGPIARALHVSRADTSTEDEASSTALATSGAVDINIPGVVRVQADGVLARATSSASLVHATSTAAGSAVKNLRIDGKRIGDISQPTSMLIRDPLGKRVVAEVRLLERIASGAAAGEKQPADGVFRSALAVNAIHVIVRDTPAAAGRTGEVVVGHAESSSRFTSGIGCLDALQGLSGRAIVADLTNLAEDMPRTMVGDVILPRTGGSESKQLADLDLGIGTASGARVSTSGLVSAVQRTADATARARVNGLELLGGAIRADLIEATARADLSSPSGSTRLAGLTIGGTDVCGSAGGACRPAKDTVLLLPGAGPVLVVLNEHVTTEHGITVNAVHLYVLGEGNPLGLPAGAEIILGQAHSAARA